MKNKLKRKKECAKEAGIPVQREVASRLTVAGMGDALATYFEARACQRSEATSCAGGNTTGAAMVLAELCFDTLMEEGVKAKIALEAGVKRSLRQILCFPELDLKVPDLQELMQSTMD